MAAFTLHALALLLFENDDFLGALVFEDLGLNRSEEAERASPQASAFVLLY